MLILTLLILFSLTHTAFGVRVDDACYTVNTVTNTFVEGVVAWRVHLNI